MKPRSTVPSSARPLVLALCSVLLWPLQAAAQLDSTSFGPVVPRGSSALYSYAVAAGDLDGDGFADLVVTDQCGLDGLCNLDRHTGVQVMINNRDGSFHLGIRYATDRDAGSSQSVAIADVDGDHKLDVIVMNQSSISVMLGRGDGTLWPAVSHPVNIYAQPAGVLGERVAVADVNGDGQPDILVSEALSYTDRFDASSSRAGVSVLLNQGNGTFADAVLYDSGGYSGATTVVAADVNRDGVPDLVVLNLCSTPATVPNGTYCVDFNTAQHLPGTVGVLLGNINGKGTFQPAIVYPSGGYEPLGLAVADLDRDGNPDVLVANRCSNSLCNDGVSGGKASVLMGKPDGSFDAPVNYDDGTLQPVSVAVADIDGDGALDAAVLNYCAVGQSCDGSTAVVSGLRGNGDGTLQQVLPTPLYPVGGIPHTVLLVDVNNDGKPDLVVGFWTGVGVRLNQTPRAATATTLDSQPNPSGDADAVTFTANVSSSTLGVPTGTVTFREGATVLGTAPLVNAAATLDVSSLFIGSHDVVASYSSDSAFRASDSDPLTQVVKASTSTSVGSSANPSPYQQSVTFTATVTSALGGPPSGSVTFKDGATVLGSSSLAGNTAALSTSSLSVGTHSITAIYDGDANHVGSTSAALSQTIANPAPTITGFAPTSGPAGTAVTIAGTDFTGATAVTFNGSAATYTLNSATQITATVPTGATTGSIAVTTPSGTATSASPFTVTTGSAPTIASFTPTGGTPGTSVTIKGTNLSGTTKVTFNGVSASFKVKSASQITATVPPNATTGPIMVTTPGGTAASASSFTIVAAPTITGFTPESGRVGTVVTITGTNFTGTTAVKFGNKSATFTVTSATSISATVPNGAKTGSISVTTPAGTAVSASIFTLTP